MEHSIEFEGDWIYSLPSGWDRGSKEKTRKVVLDVVVLDGLMDAELLRMTFTGGRNYQYRTRGGEGSRTSSRSEGS